MARSPHPIRGPAQSVPRPGPLLTIADGFQIMEPQRWRVKKGEDCRLWRAVRSTFAGQYIFYFYGVENVTGNPLFTCAVPVDEIKTEEDLQSTGDALTYLLRVHRATNPV